MNVVSLISASSYAISRLKLSNVSTDTDWMTEIAVICGALLGLSARVHFAGQTDTLVIAPIVLIFLLPTIFTAINWTAFIPTYLITPSAHGTDRKSVV